nr:MAG TPA: hypothetical protein [Caudoviricetes sp.]
MNFDTFWQKSKCEFIIKKKRSNYISYFSFSFKNYLNIN